MSIQASKVLSSHSTAASNGLGQSFAMAEANVAEPFPISLVGGRYVVYDVNTVTYIRREYNMTGVLIGGLPQAPQQNVFLGVPLELMPEEARLLVEKGAAYTVDDAEAHDRGFVQHGLGAEEKAAFLKHVQKQGVDASKAQAKSAGDRKISALKKIAEKQGQNSDNWNDIPDDMFAGPRRPKAKKGGRSRPDGPSRTASGSALASAAGDEDDLLFGSGRSTPTPALPSPAPSEMMGPGSSYMKVTPTTSHPPLPSQPPPPGRSLPLPHVPQSYALFKHMHAQDYFLAPGIRFGCQYMAYPGDPLRFHSHFLCNGMDWDQEFDLLGLVGGGRLGTGVKKGFLIGGEETSGDEDSEVSPDADRVRPFCIEWAAM